MPFVVPGNQLYLPFLAMDLREWFLAGRPEVKKLSTVAQVVALQVQKEFVNLGAQSFWSLCVEYMESSAVQAKNMPRERVDYKAVLSPADFELFAKLRELRKETTRQKNSKHPPVLSASALRNRPPVTDWGNTGRLRRSSLV